jgi:hypothetical protein
MPHRSKLYNRLRPKKQAFLILDKDNPGWSIGYVKIADIGETNHMIEIQQIHDNILGVRLSIRYQKPQVSFNKGLSDFVLEIINSYGYKDL